jgi:hypothetical protein
MWSSGFGQTPTSGLAARVASHQHEVHHGDYEQWAAERTSKFNAGTFESAITLDSLVRRSPFNATKRVAKAVFKGQGSLLPAKKMDMLFSTKPPEFMTSVGASLNVGVNELADVLHTFFLNGVQEDEDDS